MNIPKSAAPPRTSNGLQIVYSTTDGRQRFPDILQVTYGDKAVIGFDRYGRTLGAVVPVEAVLMLAGQSDQVDEDVRARIMRAATALLAQLPEAGTPAEAQRLTTLEEVESMRRQRRASTAPRKKRSG